MIAHPGEAPQNQTFAHQKHDLSNYRHNLLEAFLGYYQKAVASRGKEGAGKVKLVGGRQQEGPHVD